MRRKKRYVLTRRYPRFLPDDAEFLFQDETGFVFRTSILGAERLRPEALLVTGTMKSLREYKERARQKG
jgi:hypothetical protein